MRSEKFHVSYVIYMDVSENSGTPKSSHSNRVFHYFHHPFWGSLIFETPIYALQAGGKGRDQRLRSAYQVGDMWSFPGRYIGYYPIDLNVWDLLAGMLYRKWRSLLQLLKSSNLNLKILICDAITTDGRNPGNQLRLVVYPIIYRTVLNRVEDFIRAWDAAGSLEMSGGGMGVEVSQRKKRASSCLVGGFKYLLFSPLYPTWGNDPIWRAYFSHGWFNHQLAILGSFFFQVGHWGQCNF